MTVDRQTRGLRATSVYFTPTELVVALADGRRIATPLEWYPRLATTSGAQRENYEISPLGIHWPDIDEDLSVAGLLKGSAQDDLRAGASLRGFPSCVMAGLGPAIHDLRVEAAPRGASRAQPARRCSILEEHGLSRQKAWMPGPSPGMTREESSLENSP